MSVCTSAREWVWDRRHGCLDTGVCVPCAHRDPHRLSSQAGGPWYPAAGERGEKEGRDVGWENHPRPGTTPAPRGEGNTPRTLSWF